jgi:hypothetical protein
VRFGERCFGCNSWSGAAMDGFAASTGGAGAEPILPLQIFLQQRPIMHLQL